MRFPYQCPQCLDQRPGARLVRFAALFTLFFLCSLLARAQEAPPGTVGRVEGADVSVEGGTPASNAGSGATPAIFVVSGGVVTVHSGQARMTLTGGGRLEICGPAKFTVLESGDSVTLALSFGSMRLRLPAVSALRVFTPTLIATPLAIGSAPRDITLGLNFDKSLCVRPTAGAIRLEDQFTGDKIVIPEGGEFSLALGKLAPVPSAPGSCACEAREAAPPVPPPPVLVPETAPPANPSEPPAPVNQAHPAAAPREDVVAPAAPSASGAAGTVVLPPLVYSASSPTQPDLGPNTELLARFAHVEYGWDFSGHVAAPASAEPAPAAQALPPRPKKKKGGFWAALKRFFSG